MKPVIHIGLPKAASTTLQLRYFESHPEVKYIGSTITGGETPRCSEEFFDHVNKYPSKETPHRRRSKFFYSSLIHAEDWDRFSAGDYNPDIPKNFATCLSERTRGDKRIVLSSEGFSVGVFIPPVDTAHRLKEAFDEAAIILILRNPVEWVESRYLQIYRGIGGKIESVPPLTEWLQYNYSHRGHFQSIYHDLKWGTLINCYVNLFGSENVHVLTFEQFVNDNETFMDRVSSILGVDLQAGAASNTGSHLNPSLTQGQVMALESTLLRRFRWMQSVVSRPFRVLFSKKPELELERVSVENIQSVLEEDLELLPDAISQKLSTYVRPKGRS